MKTTHSLLTTALSLLAGMANATIHTVSNAANGIAQFNSIAAAMAAASAGDTVHVMGSSVTYPDVTVNKSLVFIGAGAWPESGPGALASTVSSFSFGTGSNGSVIKGFNLQGGASSISTVFGAVVHNITIEFCRLSGNITFQTSGSTGWLIRNNLFVQSVFAFPGNSSAQNIHLTGNIINGSLSSSGNGAGSSIVVEHNLFRSNSGANPLSALGYAVIRNNIFFGGQSDGVSNCEIYNNVFFGNYTEAGMTGGGTTVYDNIAGPDQDPLFAESSTFNAAFFSFSVSQPYPDFNLQPGSPAIGAAHNGTDAGIYSGPSPWRDNPAGGPRTYYPGAGMPWVNEVSGFFEAAPNSTLDVLLKGRNEN